MNYYRRSCAALSFRRQVGWACLLPRATRAAGLDVPGDISITGFDDIELAEIVEPGLTTVHVPHRQMGTEAARMIVALLGGEELGKSSPLATRIVHRESLGPV